MTTNRARDLPGCCGMNATEDDLLLGALRSLTEAAELASQWPLTVRAQNQRRRLLQEAVRLGRAVMGEVL